MRVWGHYEHLMRFQHVDNRAKFPYPPSLTTQSLSSHAHIRKTYKEDTKDRKWRKTSILFTNFTIQMYRMNEKATNPRKTRKFNEFT